MGLWSCRVSGPRFSCARSMMGTSSSRASSFMARVMSETSCCLESLLRFPMPVPLMSCM